MCSPAMPRLPDCIVKRRDGRYFVRIKVNEKTIMRSVAKLLGWPPAYNRRQPINVEAQEAERITRKQLGQDIQQPNL